MLADDQVLTIPDPIQKEHRHLDACGVPCEPQNSIKVRLSIIRHVSSPPRQCHSDNFLTNSRKNKKCPVTKLVLAKCMGSTKRSAFLFGKLQATES